MNEKILLINPPYKNKEIVYFPLGLGYIAGACAHAGIDVECLDLNVNNLSNEQIINKITKDSYHIIGIGGFAIQLKSTLDICNIIKTNLPDIIIIIGGVQVYGCGDFILNNSKADIVCTGEFEIILPELIHRLYEGKNLNKIPSIKYRHNNVIINNGGFALVPDLNKLYFPKYDIFNIDKYIKGHYHSDIGKRTLDLLVSRGCPFKCRYCINSKKTIKVRYRNVDSIINEIRFLKSNYQINDFACTDEIFTINKRKALEICEAFRTEDVTWITMVRADGIDEELLSAMKKAGCRRLYIGFESGSEKILKSMNKKVNITRYYEAIRLLRKYDINFFPAFMIGMPEETEETIKETERFCIENRLIYGPSFVTPFPGSKLYDDIKDNIDEKEYLMKLYDINYVKKPIVNLTNMGISKLIYLRKRTTVNSIASILISKYKIIPMPLLRAACWTYITIFYIDNLLLTKIIRFINKIIYKFMPKGTE